MPTPHKHAELIKAWADGAEIESKLPYEDTWTNCPQPIWSVATEYRIKPKTIKYRNFLWKPHSTRDPAMGAVMYEE